MLQQGNGVAGMAKPANELAAAAPQIGRAFGQFFHDLMKDGALSAKQKELIALAIGVAVHCPPCIDAHVEKAVKAGASDAEIMEAAGVAVVMGGGPAYTNARLAATALSRSRPGAAPSEER
jgi:AhpD family alkylhydroperoxidase